MDIDKLFDIPAHPLLVHVPVVLTPLAALGAILMVFVPRLRRRLDWLVVGAAVLAAIGTQLAIGSGQKLELRIDKSRALAEHAHLARVARPLVALFALSVIGFVVMLGRRDRSARSELLMRGVAGLTVVSGLLATLWMVRAGHQGALVTWKGVGIRNG